MSSREKREENVSVSEALAREVQEMSRRCDFCESSLDQLKRNLRDYLNKKTELKNTHHMSTMMKNVASTETNPQLQDCFFKCSEAYDGLDRLLCRYSDCEKQQKLLLEEAKKLLIQPIRDSMNDCNKVLKKKGTKKTKTNHNVEYEINQRILHNAAILPHHSQMFEKHRIRYMKGILKSVLSAELQYHCKAIETLSPLFYSLSQVDDSDIATESSLMDSELVVLAEEE